MNPESTDELLQRVKTGDQDALDRLLGHYVVPLRRWAHGRLPPWARDLSDTQDLVQDALLNTTRHVKDFEPVGPAALHSYLRLAVINRIRDEVRRVRRRPPSFELDDRVPDESASPMEKAIGKQALEAFIAALAQLSDDDRALLISRIKCRLSYQEIAAIFNKPTSAAACMAVRRALLKLASLMRPAMMGIPT